MTYKNKKVSRLRETEYAVPTITSMDDIASLTDDELITKLRYLEDSLAELLHSAKHSLSEAEESYVRISWETEICYAKREIQLRKIRREKHEEYVKSLPQDSYEEVVENDDEIEEVFN